ncbi:MAG TPA: hypothetical protein VLU41_06730, partial [Ideonella sp.]|nr:hypothetical protein [Ideonella sp.]
MSWRALEEELARWRGAGRTVEFWWRDDDASRPCEPLARLLALSQRAAVPLALAVVPLEASPGIFAGLRASVLMHGTDHRNRAAAGEKKTEFPGAEPEAAALERLGRARERLAALAGSGWLPVLAPPWNRFARALVARLPQAGLHGFSAYGARRAAQAASGVIEVNTHVDIIDWHGSRRFAGDGAVLGAAARHLAARREGAADATE